jgi:hypothetical protein
MVALPFTNTAMAAHPAFLEALQRLRDWGVGVIFGDDVVPLSPPGFGDAGLEQIPWSLVLTRLDELRPTGIADELPV